MAQQFNQESKVKLNIVCIIWIHERKQIFQECLMNTFSTANLDVLEILIVCHWPMDNGNSLLKRFKFKFVLFNFSDDMKSRKKSSSIRHFEAYDQKCLFEDINTNNLKLRIEVVCFHVVLDLIARRLSGGTWCVHSRKTNFVQPVGIPDGSIRIRFRKGRRLVNTFHRAHQLVGWTATHWTWVGIFLLVWCNVLQTLHILRSRFQWLLVNPHQRRSSLRVCLQVPRTFLRGKFGLTVKTFSFFLNHLD